MTNQLSIPSSFLNYKECYYTQRGKFDDLKSTIEILNTSGYYSDLDRIAFMLIKPDAVVSGKAVELLNRLHQNGFILVYFKINNQKRERNFEELYKFNLTKHNAANMLSAWWLARRVYTMGPSVEILLTHQDVNCRGKCLYDLLGTIKGVSNPYACDPLSIRGGLRGCNRSLNLMHASDSPMATVREFMIFRDVASLIDGIQLAVKMRVSGLSSNDLLSTFSFLKNSLHWWNLEKKVSLSYSIAVISARLLSIFDWRMKDLPIISHLLDLYNQIALIDYIEHNSTIAFASLNKLLNQVASELRLLHKGENTEVIKLLLGLCSPLNYNYQIAENILIFAKARKINIDPWDSLALETSMFHAKDFP